LGLHFSEKLSHDITSRSIRIASIKRDYGDSYRHIGRAAASSHWLPIALQSLPCARCLATDAVASLNSRHPLLIIQHLPTHFLRPRPILLVGLDEEGGVGFEDVLRLDRDLVGRQRALADSLTGKDVITVTNYGVITVTVTEFPKGI
jgi:hypothetical protein